MNVTSFQFDFLLNQITELKNTRDVGRRSFLELTNEGWYFITLFHSVGIVVQLRQDSSSVPSPSR